MPNRLSNQTSPYLLQHAHNPVDWFPWGPEALALARETDRPILLSVGYSACHWCHVMERESFEDATTAALMNRHFVNIKVDREERPDLDALYMQAVMLFTGGHGGWPMTVFLTPKGEPYFGGTYFPPKASRGMPSFTQVLEHAANLYSQRRDDVLAMGREVLEELESLARMPSPHGKLSDGWLESIVTGAAQDFDAEHAGFGGAPKFPPHGTLAALLAAWRRTGDEQALSMATATLDAMAKGGMADLAGGGFARYSVDAEWRIPHFEKMLYDNGQLAPIYLDAFKATGKPHYARIARELFEFVLRDLRLESGGFASALDADSEGEEGVYYTFTPGELRETLGLMDGLRACALLQVTEAGTFEHGRSVLRLERPQEELDEADRALLDRALPKLLARRQARVPPGRDDKVLTAWNALMIGALAKGAATLNEPRYLQAAKDAARAVLGDGGRLLRSQMDGRPGPAAFFEDYAFLCDALIDLYEASGEEAWLTEALRLADASVSLFWDEDGGGFWLTGRDAEPLVAPNKALIGGATPSGNGVATLAFTRLEALTGRTDLGEKADRVLRSLQPLLSRASRAFGPEAIAAAWRAGRALEIGVVGPIEGREALLAEVRRRYLPFVVLTAGDVPSPLTPFMAGRAPQGGLATAYVCEDGACRLPVTTPEALAALLDELTRPRRRAGATGRLTAPELPNDPSLWLNTEAPLQLSALRGQVIVLDFWTYCCVNCLHVLPELAALEERFEGQPVVFVGVHSAKFDAERDPENVRRALGRHNVTHPVLLDPEHAVWSEYAVKAWPTLMVIDAQGKIAWQGSGEVRRDVLGEIVRRVLAEEESPAAPRPLTHSAPPSNTTLLYPGKVALWPDAAEQLRDTDPFAPDARLYVSDTGHHRVIEASLGRGPDGWPAARILRVWGDGSPGDRDGANPQLNSPQGLARDGALLYVADTGNHSLRVVNLEDGQMRRVAGSGRLGKGDGGGRRGPLEADLRSPWDVAAAEGVVFIAMAGAHQLWVYHPDRGALGPFVGSGREEHIDGAPNEAALAQPSGLLLLGRFLFWTDAETSSVRLFDLAEGRVSTLVGAGLFDFGDIDGQGEAVRLQHPLAITGGDDALYVADTFNHKIKRLELGESVTVRTLCGGDPAELCEPGGLCIAGEFLIVADTNNHRLRAVDWRTGAMRDLPLD